jgi:hypothetical protein
MMHISGVSRLLFGAGALSALDIILLWATQGLITGTLGAFLAVLLLFPPAAVGAYLIRRGACYREVTATALLAAIVLILLTVLTPLNPAMGLSGDPVQGLVFVLVATAGVFLLPLLDPVVRVRGPAPNRRSVVLASLVLTLTVVAMEYATTRQWGGFGYSFFGIGTLAMGSVGALGLVGAGVLLTLADRQVHGATVGGAGLALAAGAIAVWVATGMKWFP